MQTKDINAANPQGKASIALLDDLNQFNNYKPCKKEIPEWIADYFTSLLVLSASFSFKPVTNKKYYLYLDKGQWKLSLISPIEWSNCPYCYFAECKLHDDRTWSLTPISDWHDNSEISNFVDSIKKEFFSSLNTDKPIIDSLPYFAEHLPYYQRLAAFGLANSLKDSLQLKLGHDISQVISSKSVVEEANNSGMLRLNFTIHQPL